MTGQPDRQDEVEILSHRLRDVQGLSSDRASALARKIAGADVDIWSVAMRWARVGEVPPEPEIEGYTPDFLFSRMSPSAALTALMALRREPARAASALRHHRSTSTSRNRSS